MLLISKFIMVIRFLFILLFSFQGLAQDNYISKDFNLSIKPYGSYAILSLELEPGAKTYWRNPGESGLPTQINFLQSENLAETKIFWPIPNISHEEGSTSYIYQGTVNFVIKTIPKIINQDIDLNIKLEFATCRENCESHSINLNTVLKPSDPNKKSTEVIQALAKTPKKSENFQIISVNEESSNKQHYLKIKIANNYDLKHPKLFLDLPSHIQFNPEKFEIIKNLNNQEIIVPIALHNDKQHINQIYLNLLADNGETAEYENIIKENSYSFVWILLYALLGGLILNIMPCVLPIIALKTLQIIKLSGQADSEIRKNLLLQTLGIIASFVAIAIFSYLLKQIGQEVGFGFHFQQPLYLITMIIILSLVAISLVAEKNINIQLPQSLTKLLTDNRRTSISFFLNGVLATMLALPCTAPFITIAIGFALTANFLEMLIIFIFMGIGMSFPYLCLSALPKIGRIFPKPGEWMAKFKKFLGIVIFATSIWLIYIISDQLGNKAAITLFLLIILLKFVIIEEKLFINKAKIILAAILVSLCYFIPFDFYKEKNQEEKLIETTWRKYAPQEIPALIEDNYIVILDVTASWCLTCKINKITTLDNIEVMNFMKNRGIVGMRADITKGNTEAISALMRNWKHYGIPLNIVYAKKNPNGIILPTLLTPTRLINILKEQ